MCVCVVSVFVVCDYLFVCVCVFVCVCGVRLYVCGMSVKCGLCV